MAPSGPGPAAAGAGSARVTSSSRSSARSRRRFAASGSPVDLPEANRSTIVSVPLDGREPGPLLARLKERGVVCAARDGHLRASVHFYNHEEDIARLVDALNALDAI